MEGTPGPIKQTMCRFRHFNVKAGETAIANGKQSWSYQIEIFTINKMGTLIKASAWLNPYSYVQIQVLMYRVTSPIPQVSAHLSSRSFHPSVKLWSHRKVWMWQIQFKGLVSTWHVWTKSKDVWSLRYLR